MKKPWNKFKEDFNNLDLASTGSRIEPSRIKQDVLDEICRRLIKRATTGGIYTYTELVEGLNFGTEEEPYHIFYDTWGNGDSRALVGAYLFHADQLYLNEADALIGLIVVSQGELEPSPLVRKFLYEQGAYGPDSDMEWDMFKFQQMNKVHAWAKSLRHER